MLGKEAMQGHPASAGQMPNPYVACAALVARRAFPAFHLADALALLSLDAKTKRFQLQTFRKRMSHIRDLVPMLAMQIAHKGSHLAGTAYRRTLVDTNPVTRLIFRRQ
jgi:hypothetical protein